MNPFQDPLDDTQPRITIQPSDTRRRGASWLGWASLLGAFLFTAGTVLLFLRPPAEMPPPAQTEEPQLSIPTIESSPVVEQVASPEATQAVALLQPEAFQPLPTLNAERLEALLANAGPLQVPADLARYQYDPFTFIPDRPRSEFIEYTVVRGDTVDAIARRFGLKTDTIAWCNDRRIIFVLRPGDVLRIPPVDGACHVVLGSRNLTIAQIAQEYKIDDPYQVVDSPFNPQLYGRSPDDVLSSGVTIFLPGGQGEVITWNPGYQKDEDASGNIRSVTFAAGQPGSCGAVPPGGGTFWTNPLPNGTWTRGFFVGHSGIDLAAPQGTPIYAANGGPVIFSGFSSWGYGETIVLAHGRISTLYAHMVQRNLVCGQVAAAGQVIGLVGSTGNSSGPHLHFEIRFDDVPQDPSGTPGIGW